MASVKVIERIDAPVQKVWKVVEDFGDLSFVGDAVKSCTVDGTGVGCVRRLEMADGGGVVLERLDAYDAAGYRFAYTIVNDDESPLPFQGYSSRFSLRPLGPDATELEWAGAFEPKGVSDEEASGVVNAIYSGGVEGIKGALGL